MGLCQSKKEEVADGARFESGSREYTSQSGKRERTDALVQGVASTTTFYVKIATKKQKVKLRDITSPGHDFNDVAKGELGRMINTKTVSLDVWEKKDGVWHADAYVGKVFIQGELVKLGLAKVKENATRRELLGFEETAKKKCVGCWAPEKPKKK